MAGRRVSKKSKSAKSNLNNNSDPAISVGPSNPLSEIISPVSTPPTKSSKSKASGEKVNNLTIRPGTSAPTSNRTIMTAPEISRPVAHPPASIPVILPGPSRPATSVPTSAERAVLDTSAQGNSSGTSVSFSGIPRPGSSTRSRSKSRSHRVRRSRSRVRGSQTSQASKSPRSKSPARRRVKKRTSKFVNFLRKGSSNRRIFGVSADIVRKELLQRAVSANSRESRPNSARSPDMYGPGLTNIPGLMTVEMDSLGMNIKYVKHYNSIGQVSSASISDSDINLNHPRNRKDAKSEPKTGRIPWNSSPRIIKKDVVDLTIPPPSPIPKTVKIDPVFKNIRVILAARRNVGIATSTTLKKEQPLQPHSTNVHSSTRVTFATKSLKKLTRKGDKKSINLKLKAKSTAKKATKRDSHSLSLTATTSAEPDECEDKYVVFKDGVSHVYFVCDPIHATKVENSSIPKITQRIPGSSRDSSRKLKRPDPLLDQRRRPSFRFDIWNGRPVVFSERKNSAFEIMSFLKGYQELILRSEGLGTVQSGDLPRWSQFLFQQPIEELLYSSQVAGFDDLHLIRRILRIKLGMNSPRPWVRISLPNNFLVLLQGIAIRIEDERNDYLRVSMLEILVDLSSRYDNSGLVPFHNDVKLYVIIDTRIHFHGTIVGKKPQILILEYKLLKEFRKWIDGTYSTMLNYWEPRQMIHYI